MIRASLTGNTNSMSDYTRTTKSLTYECLSRLCRPPRGRTNFLLPSLTLTNDSSFGDLLLIILLIIMIMRERSIHFEWRVCSKKITTKVQINYTQIYTTVVKMTTKLLRRYVLRRYKIAKTKKPKCGVRFLRF